MLKKAMLKTTSKLYQFTSIFIIILFLTACVGSATVKKDTGKTSTTSKVQTVDSSIISTMNTDEKIKYAEKLFSSALSANKSDSEKNTLLSNALLVCTQIVVDSHQMTLSHEQTAFAISPEEYDYSLQLINKIMSQLNTSQLTHEQNNQYRLTSATLSLTNYQIDKALAQLNIDFISTQNDLWSLYYQLRAMTEFQLGQQIQSVKELIIRHDFLVTEQEKQANKSLIWNYLAGINLNEQTQNYSQDISNNDHIYFGWLNLAKILRDSKDPQTMNNAINFWLQTYPDHQADRAFINRIIQVRQASVIDVKHIAVLLPQQGKLAKPAKAIRDGIMASHYQSSLSANLQIRFYDTGNNDHIWLTYQQAIDNGANFIIGPLAKSNLEVLSESTELSVPTLALNSLEPNNLPEPEKANTAEKQQFSAIKPAHLFQFGLSPESSARMVADKARKDGHYYAAIMAPNNAWGKRMKMAFSTHWEKSGGVVVDSVDYDSKVHDFSDSIKSMLNINLSESRKKEVSRTIGRKLEFTPRRRQDVDMLFMAAFPRQAKQIPLQVIYHHGETIPIYSTSHIVSNYQNARQNIDMDGVNFSDMPFLLGSIDNTASQQNTYQSTLYQRLFAMGVDSYQLAPYVEYLYKNPSESFSGDTGQITIDSNGHIVRALPWAIFDQGNVKLQNPSLNSSGSSSNINSSKVSNDNASLH
ncbi:MAG: penicillin-binding protein activator [Gammaproteobacteria bacterium]|nr:penicillin-binding protein activator [Gammaproteobacteria bacterium]